MRLSEATVNATAGLQKPDWTGSFEIGKRGDLVATKGNPLEGSTQMESVIFVMNAEENYTDILR